MLVSRTLTDLVMGSGIEFEDRGEYELKGIPGIWKLFAVADRQPTLTVPIHHRPVPEFAG